MSPAVAPSDMINCKWNSCYWDVWRPYHIGLWITIFILIGIIVYLFLKLKNRK